MPIKTAHTPECGQRVDTIHSAMLASRWRHVRGLGVSESVRIMCCIVFCGDLLMYVSRWEGGKGQSNAVMC